MSDQEREDWDEDWSRRHYGQFFGRAPLLPYHEQVPEVLHLELTQVGDAWYETIQVHLQPESYKSQPHLKETSRQFQKLHRV